MKLNKKRKYNNKEVIKKIDDFIYLLDNMDLFHNKKKMVIRNFFAGVIKGIGTGIGFTVLTGILIYILQHIIRLNIPIIGKYISDIVDIVQSNNL